MATDSRSTDSQDAAPRLEHLNRVLYAIRNVNQLICRCRERGPLLEGACHCLVETRGYFNAWIALVNAEGRFDRAYRCGVEEGFDDVVSGLEGGRPPRCGRMAMQRGDLVVTDEPHAVCADCPLATNYAGRGSITAPLKHEDRLFGFLSLSVPRAMVDNEEELELVGEITGDLAFALHDIEVSAERDRLTGRLERADLIVENSPCVLFRWRAEPGWPVDYVSENVRQFGFDPDDLRSGRVRYESIVHPDDLNRVSGEVARHTDAGDTRFRQEYRLVGPDGQTIWIDDRTTIERDDLGRPLAYQGIVIDISETRRVTQALRASEENLRATLQSIGDAVIATDTDGAVTRMNPVAARLTGWPADEARGKPLTEIFRIVNANTRRTTANPIAKVLETGHVVGLANHTVLIARDGAEFQIADSAAPIRGADGETVGVVLVFRDVTAEYRMVETLREQERILNDTGLLAQVGGWEHDLVTGEAVWTRPLYAIVGIEPGEPIPGPNEHLDYYPPESRAVLEAAYTRAVQQGTPFDLELQGYRTDGQPHWWRVVGEPVFEDGRCVRMRGALQDIDQRKRAEQALRESEQIYRALVEQAADCLILHDLEGNIRDVNEYACRTYGYARSELLAMKVSDLDPDYVEREGGGAFWEGLRPYRPVMFEARQRKKSGEIVPVEVRLSLIVLRGEALVLGLCRDISERREMERRLVHSQKMDAIGQLAGGVAHDFNNQLSGIMGYAEMLTKRLDDPKLRQYAEGVLTGARRAGDLTAQLLAFARRGQFQSVTVNIHETIHEVVSILEHSIDKRIEIRQHLDAGRPTVQGDPGQLQNALLNLGLNARDAMPEGGRLTFATRTVDLDEDACRGVPYDIEPGRYLRIEVTDTGCGMSEEVLAHLFEPFFTTKDTGKGTGMGLAAVYGTVTRQGGAIAATSRVGEGSAFRIDLPLAEAEDDPTEIEPSQIPVTATQNEAAILVIDDEKLFRDMAADMFEDLGYRVETVADAEAAVDLFRRRHEEFDLVVLDMIMPKMGGRQIYHALRKTAPEVKVLLASGYSLDGEAQTLLDEGVAGFIQKPFEQADLSRAVREALGEG